MFTVCPGCTRQFQVYEEHLTVASGQVRCGFCHERFNAMDRLHDKPLSNESIFNEKLRLEIKVKPPFNTPEIAEPQIAIADEDISITNSRISTDQEFETAINEVDIGSPVDESKFKIENKTTESIEKPVLNTGYHFPEIEELFSQKESVNDDWSRLSLLWTTASIVALIILIGQLFWFNRDHLLLKYPELLPYAKQICNEWGCQLIRRQDLNAIRLVNRDVRLHPDYQDTLLVNAAMKNELPIRQPYPRVQLTLFDTSGFLLGYRVFVPNDYLDSSIDIDKGMPIDSPVYFVLEVSGSITSAVSFEFHFL